MKRSPELSTALSFSAHRLVLALLQAEGLHDKHRDEFIRLALWKVTEASGGKYLTGYISEAALAIRRRGSRERGLLRHEHVVPRLQAHRELVKLLGKPQEEVEAKSKELLRLCPACVITIEEHNLLNDREFGWFRYIRATEPIAVCDDAGVRLSDSEMLTLATNHRDAWLAHDFDPQPAKKRSRRSAVEGIKA